MNKSRTAASAILATGLLVLSVAAQDDDRSQRFRDMSTRAENEGLAEPYRGIIAGGQIQPGLFSLQSTGVSTDATRLAAENFLSSLFPEQLDRTKYAVDDPEWRKSFLGSYGFLSGAEPDISPGELETLREVIDLMKVNPKAAAAMLNAQRSEGSSAALDFILANLNFPNGEPDMAVAGVVVDHGEVARAVIDQRVDQLGRIARLAEAADQHHGPVSDPGDGLGHAAHALVDHRFPSNACPNRPSIMQSGTAGHQYRSRGPASV